MLIFSGLLALIMIISNSSCGLIFSQNENEKSVAYILGFSFQDASGNDLVKGIELEDGYSLYITASQECEEVIAEENRRPGFMPDNPRLALERMNGYSFLTTNHSLDLESCPNEKVLTYKLKCYYVFGDYEEHEIVTYWEVPKINNHVAYATCKRIEFESDVLIPISYGTYGFKIIIILKK